MKKTILPALAMLIISAVMLSTASYAWFAMGATVTAENMNVSVKSDSAYLVILTPEQFENSNYVADGKIKEGVTQQSVQFNPTTSEGHKEVYPVAFGYVQNGTDGEGNPIYEPDLNPSADSKTYNFAGDNVWYTMEGTNAADGTGKAGTLTPLTNVEALKDYVLLSTVYIATSKGSNDMANLKAMVSISGDDAINVVVVTSTAYEHFTNPSSAYGKSLAGTVNNIPIKVDIYVFYNGNDTTITTNALGLKQIDKSSITVSFQAE